MWSKRKKIIAISVLGPTIGLTGIAARHAMNSGDPDAKAAFHNRSEVAEQAEEICGSPSLPRDNYMGGPPQIDFLAKNCKTDAMRERAPDATHTRFEASCNGDGYITVTSNPAEGESRDPVMFSDRVPKHEVRYTIKDGKVVKEEQHYNYR